MLGLVVSDALYKDFPDSDEGILTTIRSTIVAAKTIGQVARDLKLDELLRVSHGIRKTGPVSRALCANLFESITGAIYLDAGLPAARAWLLKVLAEAMERIVDQNEYFNWKTKLQHLTQKRFKSIPEYRLEDTVGPHHAPEFKVAVYIDDQAMGFGQGKKKKGAEQTAARQAFQSLTQKPEKDS